MKESIPAVSVVMPAYNSEAYIAEAISSALAQTMGDLELLVIDDGSSDGTIGIVKDFETKDPRVKLCCSKSNSGAAQARNLGVSLSRGEWIAFLDSDDIWRPEKLKIQLEVARKTGADFVYSSYCLLEEEARREYIVPEQVDYELLLRENVIGCSTVLIRRTSLGEDTFPENVYHEDYALWLKLIRKGCLARGCAQVLVDWRVIKSSRSFNKWHAAKCRWEIYRKVEKLPLTRAVKVFVSYMFRGVRKHRRL